MGTFGLVFVGSVGGTFLFLAVLEKKGYPINTKLVSIAAETAKYSTLLYLVFKVMTTFL